MIHTGSTAPIDDLPTELPRPVESNSSPKKSSALHLKFLYFMKFSLFNNNMNMRLKQTTT